MRTKKLQKKASLKGIVLIELIVFIVVVAFAVLLLGNIYRHTILSINTPLINHQLAMMAQSQIELIASRKYDENSPDDGSGCGAVITCVGIGLDNGELLSDVATLDDIDDFNGYIDNPRPGFSLQVNVAYAGSRLNIDNQSAKQVTVSVTANTGESVSFSIYRVNY
jgi:MSHA pilin protein MshD